MRSRSGSNVQLFAESKVVTMSNGVGIIYDNTTFQQLTGHTFRQNRDFVFPMNGDEDASTPEGGKQGTFTTPGYDPGTGGIFTWSMTSQMEPGYKNGAVRFNLLVVCII